MAMQRMNNGEKNLANHLVEVTRAGLWEDWKQMTK